VHHVRILVFFGYMLLVVFIAITVFIVILPQAIHH